MFALTTPTAALLSSVTPRTECHGDDVVVAVSMKLKITGPNTLLDLLSPALRQTLYTAVEGQDQLPGIEVATPLLRAKGVLDVIALKSCFEGWTLYVDHGIDVQEPITIGACKVDAFRLEAMEGGTITLTFRVGSNDVSAEEIGLLCGKLGSEISITLEAPLVKEPAIDGSVMAFEADYPGQAALLDPDDDSEGGTPDLTPESALADSLGVES